MSRVSLHYSPRHALRRVVGFIVVCGIGIVVAPRVRADEDPELNIPQLLTGFSAKETCSCAFVSEQSDAYCKEFGAQDGFAVDIEIDRTAKTATSTFISATRTAKFVDGVGCTLSD